MMTNGPLPNLILSVAVFLIIFSCSRNECEPIEYFEDGNPKVVVCLVDDLSFYSHYDEKQNLEMTYFLDDSSRYQRAFTYFNSEGRIQKIGFFRNNKREGWFTTYDEKGNVYSRSFLKNDSIFFKVQYGESDPYRVFQPRLNVKNVNLFKNELSLQAELIFPLEDTSINLENVVYAVGLKRYDEKRDTMLNGRKDTYIPVERENYPKMVDLSFKWEDSPILYYYIVDTTEYEIMEPPLIDLSEYLMQ